MSTEMSYKKIVPNFLRGLIGERRVYVATVDSKAKVAKVFEMLGYSRWEEVEEGFLLEAVAGVFENRECVLLGPGSEVEGICLNLAELESADLRWSDMKKSKLHSANLRSVDLRGADLRWAYLPCARLEGADLRGANLEGAHLSYAHLEGADLEGAIIKETNFSGAYRKASDAPIEGYEEVLGRLIFDKNR